MATNHFRPLVAKPGADLWQLVQEHTLSDLNHFQSIKDKDEKLSRKCACVACCNLHVCSAVLPVVFPSLNLLQSPLRFG